MQTSSTGTSNRCAMKPSVEKMAKPPKMLVKLFPKHTIQVSLQNYNVIYFTQSFLLIQYYYVQCFEAV